MNAGTSDTCNDCREDAQALASVLAAPTAATERTPLMARLSDPFALLVCLHCTEDNDDILVMPFGPTGKTVATQRMRDWWNAHRDGTGHTWAWCNRDGQNPPPDVAKQEARAYMAKTAASAPPRQTAAPTEETR